MRDDIAVRGGYGPELLPSACRLFMSAKTTAVACRACVRMRYSAQRDERARFTADNDWQRLKSD